MKLRCQECPTERAEVRCRIITTVHDFESDAVTSCYKREYTVGEYLVVPFSFLTSHKIGKTLEWDIK